MNKKARIPNYVWILPRPRRQRYKGGFPLYFEKKLIELLKPDGLILQPFAGMAEYGIRIDISPEVDPDIFADAHYLPFKDHTFSMVVCDPPYNEKYASELYNSSESIKYSQYISEAVRVCKPRGYVVSYHWALTPRPPQTSYHSRIFIAGRIWHRPRVACIFQKEAENPKFVWDPSEVEKRKFILKEFQRRKLGERKKMFRLEGIKKLLSILACPICKSELSHEVKEDDITEGSLHCHNCLVSYSIKKGKPYLFPTTEKKPNKHPP